MKVHNLVIYHCQCCGRVVHQDPELAIPDCCGRSMIRAASETVYDADEPCEHRRDDVVRAGDDRPAFDPRRPR